MEAIVLAGGFGTRLRKMISGIPKPMVQVGGRPFLEYILLYLRHHGVGRVILSTGYREEVIREYFGDSFRGIQLGYSVEEKPLGTGGGVRKAMGQCREEMVWVLNGDTFFEVNLPAMYAFHMEKRASVTLAGKKMKKPGRYGLVNCDGKSRVRGFREKDPAAEEGVINGGLYLISTKEFLAKPLPEAFSLEHDFLEVYAGKEKFMLYLSDGYFIDIGIPDDLARARNEYEYFRKYE